jgi:peptidylprolyl isomerase
MIRTITAVVLALALAGGAAAEDKKAAPKLPPLDAKEWKDLKDGDGLKVWDVKEGKGEAATASAIVTIHYTGWLTDGTVFDSSVLREKKATFPLDNLIPGWKKGIPGMKPGGVRRLHIPWKLAYGEDGRPPRIPAKADLVFEVELFAALSAPSADAKEWKELKDGDGIKYWDVAEGKGDECKPGATVTIHYTGWTLDGKMFDSSVTRGEAATFPLGDLIKGWQKGIPGMKPGGKRRLLIPWKLAYGEEGSPPTIPAKADLIFEVELFESK